MVKSVTEDPKKPDINEFQIGIQLGQGNFSTVSKAVHKVTNETFALKKMEKQRVNRLRIRHPNIFNEIHMEKKVLNKLKHPNIITLYHTFQDPGNLYFLMEFMEGGELWDKLGHKGKLIGLDEEMAKFYAADIVNALEHLRDNGIVHRDLKPENMLVSSKDGHIRIADFGTAKDLNDSTLNGPNFVGTPEYMPPETVNNKQTTTSGDLWALGCIIYQLLSGETPFRGGSAYLTFLKVQKGDYCLPEFFSEESKDLIRKLLKMVPNNRIGASSLQEIKDHPFFKGVLFDLHMELSCPKICEKEKNYREIVDKSLEGLSQNSIPFKSYIDEQDQSNGRLMHIFRRMGKLQEPEIYSRFFKNAIDSRFQYAKQRSYLGLSRDEENQWNKPFCFVHITNIQLGLHAAVQEGNDSDGSTWEVEIRRLEEAIEKINKLAPKFVVVGGKSTYASNKSINYEPQLASLKEILNQLHPSIRIMINCGEQTDVDSYTSNFGDDYYSFWCEGVKFIVYRKTGSEDNMIDQREWFNTEMEQGKLCSHHLIVIGNDYLCEHDSKVQQSNESNNDRFEERHTVEAKNLIETIKKNGTHMVLSGDIQTPYTLREIPCVLDNPSTTTKPLDDDADHDDTDEQKTKFINTPSFTTSASDNPDQLCIGIVNVNRLNVKYECYSLKNIPETIVFETEETQ